MRRGVVSIILLVFLSAFHVSDTPDVVAQLREKIDAFNRKYKRAKLDLMFNQPKYGPGDTALVRTYYHSATDLKPIDGSQIVHVEVFDVQGTRVIKNQVLVTNGFSSNQLIIPQDLVPGMYLLVAYSDWMKNLDQSLFFRHELIVTGKERLQLSTAGQPRLYFYPEGGTLVSGVENNMLVRLEGQIQNKGVAIRSTDQEIGSVTLDAQGMGFITWTPEPNVSYYAEVSSGGETKKFELPSVRSTGLSIRVFTDDPGKPMKVKLAGLGSALEKKYVMVVANRSGIVYSRAIEFKNFTAVEVELPEELPSGIGQVTVVDQDQTQWLNRTIFINGKVGRSVIVRQAKKDYATREKGSIEVQATDRMGNPLQGQFTVRIIHDELFNDRQSGTTGGLRQICNDIGATFCLAGDADEAKVNQYLISQNVPWLKWERMTDDGAPIKYLPLRTLVISGKATFLDSGKPVPDSTQLMFFLQKQIAGYEVYTNSKGEFVCPILFDFSGIDQVFYAATRRGADLRDVTVQLTKVDSVFDFKASAWTGTSKEDAYGVYNLKKKTIEKSFGYFSRKKDHKDSVADPNAAMEDELQGADLTLKISDYILFPTMVDLVREVLRAVDYRKFHGRDIIRVYTTGKRPTNDAGPLYVIDGVLTKNSSTFLGLKPSEVLTIKLVKDSNKLSKFGTLGANGVILVRTKNNLGKALLLQENSFTLEGMAPRFIEGTQVKNAGNSLVPDLRPCLFWGAHNVLDASGKVTIPFVTSDDVGTYRIEIEGLTSDGTPFSASDTFQVRYNQP